MEGRTAAKLEPDTPATFGDSAGVALKDDKDQGEAPWKSTLPAMGQQHLVDEIMSDATDELSPREEPPQEPQVGVIARNWPALQHPQIATRHHLLSKIMGTAMYDDIPRKTPTARASLHVVHPNIAISDPSYLSSHLVATIE